jgi:hypothetical protein
MMFDGKAFGEEVVGFVREYLERELAPVKAENESLKARISELEARKPEKGEKGDPGDKGETGDRGDNGSNGENGKDAAGIVEALKDSGELVLTLADGRLIRTGIRDGEKGLDGKDGENGFSLDDFDMEAGDDGRTYILKFQRGDTRHEYELTFPVPVFCQVFKAGTEYFPGDLVLWAGSTWHCNEKTTEKPGEGPWSIFCKKGRDGKDAKNG